MQKEIVEADSADATCARDAMVEEMQQVLFRACQGIDLLSMVRGIV